MVATSRQIYEVLLAEGALLLVPVAWPSLIHPELELVSEKPSVDSSARLRWSAPSEGIQDTLPGHRGAVLS